MDGAHPCFVLLTSPRWRPHCKGTRHPGARCALYIDYTKDYKVEIKKTNTNQHSLHTHRILVNIGFIGIAVRLRNGAYSPC